MAPPGLRSRARRSRSPLRKRRQAHAVADLRRLRSGRGRATILRGPRRAPLDRGNLGDQLSRVGAPHAPRIRRSPIARRHRGGRRAAPGDEVAVELSDSIVRHLRQVVDRPDLTGTRYELENEMGRGGMGVVYAARDRELDRRVAPKVMDAALSDEPRLIARLEHPAIVPVYESGALADGRVFYAMKLVSGARLDRYVESDPPLSERLRVIQRVGEALGFAHAQ